jgi:hypothetical protein
VRNVFLRAKSPQNSHFDLTRWYQGTMFLRATSGIRPR